LWLGDHELATDELDRLARPEDTQVDEPLVLGPREATGPDLVARHGAHRIGSLSSASTSSNGDTQIRPTQRPQLDTLECSRDLR
jgi:hypothetical protein